MDENETMDENKPMDMEDKPMDVGDKPMDVGDKPMDMGDKPMDMEDKPMDVGDKPMDMGDKPMDMPEAEPSSDNDNTFNLDDMDKDKNMNFGPISGITYNSEEQENSDDKSKETREAVREPPIYNNNETDTSMFSNNNVNDMNDLSKLDFRVEKVLLIMILIYHLIKLQMNLPMKLPMKWMKRNPNVKTQNK